MVTSSEFQFAGHAGSIVGTRWDTAQPRYIAILAHGYGEHIGRYEYVAQRLVADGAAVYGVDHQGHGRSAGEQVVIDDFDGVVDDLHQAETLARSEHPQVPVALIGHSMGGLIAARYAQRFGADLMAVVLSGPLIGSRAMTQGLLALDEIPEVPIDPAVLSRDPAVGAAYQSDPLVWHGPFKRPMVEAIDAMLVKINDTGQIADVPVLWIHGGADQLVPYANSAEGWAVVAPSDAQQKKYPGARHEIFNETNKDEVINDVIAFINSYL